MCTIKSMDYILQKLFKYKQMGMKQKKLTDKIKL